MSKTRSFFQYWLPVLAWMALIFTASGDTSSSQRSSRIIGPILFWLFPEISPDTVSTVVIVVRKCAHLAEYGVLAILLWRALRKPRRRDPRPWSWRAVWWALLLSALYAGSDELHQMLVPSRTGMLADVFLDTCGAAIGLAVVCTVSKWWQKPRTEAASNSSTVAATPRRKR